jgi:hypothetical protein
MTPMPIWLPGFWRRCHPCRPRPVAGNRRERAVPAQCDSVVIGAHTQTGTEAAPLFLVGCVRSGTTLTRDLLRRVPGVICPEETHFLRWSEPFRTPASMPPHTQNQVLRRHREIDGVRRRSSRDCWKPADPRLSCSAPMSMPSHGPGASPDPYRWIDKTPQNIYGGALILAEFPGARLLHIVRNPLNVVASMLSGGRWRCPTCRAPSTTGARRFRSPPPCARPRRIASWTCATRTSSRMCPGPWRRVCDFAGLRAPAGLYAGRRPSRTGPLARRAGPGGTRAAVVARCGALARTHGYDLEAASLRRARPLTFQLREGLRV